MRLHHFHTDMITIRSQALSSCIEYHAFSIEKNMRNEITRNSKQLTVFISHSHLFCILNSPLIFISVATTHSTIDVTWQCYVLSCSSKDDKFFVTKLISFPVTNWFSLYDFISLYSHLPYHTNYILCAQQGFNFKK